MVDNIKFTNAVDTTYSPTTQTTQTTVGQQPAVNTPAVKNDGDAVLSKQLNNILQSVQNDATSANSVNSEMVNKIKSQLAAGTYQVNFKQLADNLLQDYSVTSTTTNE